MSVAVRLALNYQQKQFCLYRTFYSQRKCLPSCLSIFKFLLKKNFHRFYISRLYNMIFSRMCLSIVKLKQIVDLKSAKYAKHFFAVCLQI